MNVRYYVRFKEMNLCLISPHSPSSCVTAAQIGLNELCFSNVVKLSDLNWLVHCLICTCTRKKYWYFEPYYKITLKRVSIYLLDGCCHSLDESRIIDAIGDVVVLDAQWFQHPRIIIGTLDSQTCPFRNVESATKLIVVKTPAMQRSIIIYWSILWAC